MNNKLLKICIVSIIIFMVILGILLIVLKKRGNVPSQDEENSDNQKKEVVEEIQQTDWIEVENIDHFYNIENVVLDYIKKNVNYNVDYLVLNMEYKNDDDITDFFVVDGIIINKDVSQKKQMDFILKLNWQDEKYSIKVVDDLKNKNELISNMNGKEDKVINIKNLSKADCSIWYFENYKKQLLYNSDYLFEMLDKEYAEKRFNNSKDEFDKYVAQMKEKIKNINVAKYSVDYNDDNIKYRLLTSDNNYYEIIATSAMKYTIKLDNYTLNNEELNNKYDNASLEEKISTNMDEFFKMVNLKDYKSAYNLLDENFRNKNFSSVDKFQEYMEKRFFDTNIIKNINKIEKSGNYYAVTVSIASGNNLSAEYAEETFIMDLREGTDFKMSFRMR